MADTSSMVAFCFFIICTATNFVSSKSWKADQFNGCQQEMTIDNGRIQQRHRGNIKFGEVICHPGFKPDDGVKEILCKDDRWQVTVRCIPDRKRRDAEEEEETTEAEWTTVDSSESSATPTLEIIEHSPTTGIREAAGTSQEMSDDEVTRHDHQSDDLSLPSDDLTTLARKVDDRTKAALISATERPTPIGVAKKNDNDNDNDNNSIDSVMILSVLLTVFVLLFIIAVAVIVFMVKKSSRSEAIVRVQKSEADQNNKETLVLVEVSQANGKQLPEPKAGEASENVHGSPLPLPSSTTTATNETQDEDKKVEASAVPETVVAGGLEGKAIPAQPEEQSFPKAPIFQTEISKSQQAPPQESTRAEIKDEATLAPPPPLTAPAVEIKDEGNLPPPPLIAPAVEIKDEATLPPPPLDVQHPVQNEVQDPVECTQPLASEANKAELVAQDT